MLCRVMLFIVILASLAFPLSEVKNQDKPLKGNWDFKPEKVWSLSKVGDELFANPRQVMAADDGTVYVYDNKNKRYYIFNSSGELLKAFGKQGEGPGEIKRIQSANFFLVKDKMIIADIDRLHYFSKDGVFIKSKINQNLLKRPVCFLNEDLFISYPFAIPFTEDTTGKIIKYHLKSKQETVIGQFKVFRGGTDRRSSEQRPTVVVMGITPMLILNRYNDRLYYGTNDSYVINIADLDGKKISSFRLERKVKDISGKALIRRFSSLPQKPPPDVIEAIVKTLPREHTFFTRIEIHSGLIYVFVPDLEEPNHQQIDIFSPDGKYLYRSDIKPDDNLTIIRSPFNNLFIKKDFLYIALEDETGDIMVARYKIMLPGL